MGNRRQSQPGNAVLLVILLIPILVFLARSVAWLASSSHFRSMNHRQEISGTYIMEAGLNHAATLLVEDATWEEGFDKEPMTRTNGHYTITFQRSGTGYTEGNSVNNIFGTSERDGPRGPDTVVPGTAEIVVHSQSGNVKSQGVFLLQAVFDNNNDWAVSSNGHIKMNGDVDVRGIQNVASWADVNAGMHANIYQATEAAVSWRPKDLGDEAHFTGKVSTPSRGDRAIDFAGTEGVDYSAEEFEKGVGRLAIPVPEIIQEVTNNASGSPVPAVAFGTTNLTGSDYYSPSILDLQGDLVLDGANLYVNGDLYVNGTITGTGSVWVTGKTTFKGDAYVESGPDGVAVYSEGSITMSGFNGTEFMERLSRREPQIIQKFNFAKAELFESSDRTPDGVQGRHNNNARQALNQVASLVRATLPEEGETADHIREQLATLGEVAWNNADGDNSWGRAEMARAYRQVSYGLDNIGTGYFKGTLVSNSYIHTESAVAVIGAVWATGANEFDTPKTVGEFTIKPGDIFLDDDTSILLNKEVLEDDDQASPTRLKGLDMLRWQR